MVGLFDAPVEPTARVGRSTRSARIVRRRDITFSVDALDEIGISLVLNDGAVLRIRSEGRSHSLATGLGEYGIMAPGYPTEVSIRGEVWALQMRVSLAELRASAEQDHDLDVARMDVRPTVGRPDDGLARLLWAGLAGCEVASATITREVAAHLLGRASSPRAPRPSDRGGLSPARRRRVLAYIEENLAAPMTLDAMASEAALSPFHFGREFKRTTGRTPHAYLLARRLGRAATLLQDGRLTLDAVAVASGFAHAGHLAHHMRKRHGLSCSQWRALCRF